jgi:hypothetical protein
MPRITDKQRATIRILEAAQVGFPFTVQQSNEAVMWVGIESFGGPGLTPPRDLTLTCALVDRDGNVVEESSHHYQRRT